MFFTGILKKSRQPLRTSIKCPVSKENQSTGKGGRKDVRFHKSEAASYNTPEVRTVT